MGDLVHLSGLLALAAAGGTTQPQPTPPNQPLPMGSAAPFNVPAPTAWHLRKR